MTTRPTPETGEIAKGLFKRLRVAGYHTPLLHAAVPDWWTKESESEPEAPHQLRLILARRLGLDVEAFLRSDEILPDKAPGGVQFKRSANLEEKSPSEETLSFCATLARSVAVATGESKTFPLTGGDIRNEILSSGSDYVSLEALTRYCWSRNIAVIQLTHLPGKRKGMDAMAMRMNGRDVIVVTKDAKKLPPAWLSFLIAHEIGHIALGHVGENEALADDLAEGSNGSDSKEISANAFAERVLAGSDFHLDVKREQRGLQKLVKWARGCAHQVQVDPGHAILRYAKEVGNYPLAMKAWGVLQTKVQSRQINEVALETINIEDLTEDSGNMLRGVLQLSNA